ncbi:DUF5668 domain-containing protein [Proteiniborus sp. MB09-C3]|uniref:LiaI-LiaF-like domain-containing protein n=1 Tax=Proteiniborus sp. MB09-C3 TaxID=3050072 RepID=UPI002554A690|nr:DUF5668 domain-containing protein [Proteiniborus sp. MB09-C3]WIV12536.1 DUF5668 domain-containing protein [Proteiniborus sp. MB09-C3]
MGKRNNDLLGIILILIGVLIFLLNTDLLSGNALLILIGVGFLVIYFIRRYIWSLISGMIIIVVGVTSIIDDAFSTRIDLAGFTFLVGLGIVFLVLYFTKRIMGFVFPGFILPAVGIYTLVSSIYTGEMSWAFFFLIGLSFYGIYIAEFMKRGNSWPLIPGTILIAFSAFLYLISKDIIKASFWKVISYAWPALLIIVGIKIIYDNVKRKA